MKIILSRKGFDGTRKKYGTYPNGGIPSLILPDGTLLSLPIPDNGQRNGKPYSDYEYGGESYKSIIEQVKARF